ncbi:hypothetical protein BJ508DRAFT_40190 [Ascobolus immersus RN42]|uniref:Uncharacterized protein n=1 Tax=Ascobolus immersus RN42 TaxID=1160509 RepID=A0A3N4HJS8_ASCIM|nr:hypothetical protein BJ508DRAFT_40190 [Ascobolus immersus RN42]
MPPIRPYSVLKCSFCRIDKKKCEPVPDNEKCKRCVAKGFECSGFTARSTGRTRRNNPGDLLPNPQPTTSTPPLALVTQPTADSRAQIPCACGRQMPTVVPPQSGGQTIEDTDMGWEVDLCTGEISSELPVTIPLQEVRSLEVVEAENVNIDTDTCGGQSPPPSQETWRLMLQSERRKRFRLRIGNSDNSETSNPENQDAFHGVLTKKMALARKLVDEDSEPEKTEVLCRQIMHAALLAADNSQLGDVYTEAVSILAEILLDDGRCEEALSIYKDTVVSLDKSEEPIWREITVEGASDFETFEERISRMAVSRKGLYGFMFMGTGLSFEDLIAECTPRVWQRAGDDLLLDYFRRFPLRIRFGIWLELLLDAFKFERVDIIESSLSFSRHPEIEEPDSGCFLEIYAEYLSIVQPSGPGSFRDKIQHSECIAQRLSDMLVDLLENEEPVVYCPVLKIFRFYPEVLEVFANLGPYQTNLRHLLAAILQYRRADVLKILLDQGVGPNIFRCEILQPDSAESPERLWVQDLLRDWRVQLAEFENLGLSFAGSSGLTIVQIACWKGEASIVQTLLDWMTYAKDLLISATSPLSWHRCLVHLAVLSGDTTTLKMLLSIPQRFNFQIPMGDSGFFKPSIFDVLPTPKPTTFKLILHNTKDMRGSPGSQYLYTWSCINGACEEHDHYVCIRNEFLPIHLAARLGNLEATKLLLDQKADPAFLDHNNRTVLFHAIVSAGGLQLIHLLADPSIYTRPSLSPSESVGGILTLALDWSDKIRLSEELDKLRQSNCLPPSLVDCHPLLTEL